MSTEDFALGDPEPFPPGFACSRGVPFAKKKAFGTTSKNDQEFFKGKYVFFGHGGYDPIDSPVHSVPSNITLWFTALPCQGLGFEHGWALFLDPQRLRDAFNEVSARRHDMVKYGPGAGYYDMILSNRNKDTLYGVFELPLPCIPADTQVFLPSVKDNLNWESSGVNFKQAYPEFGAKLMDAGSSMFAHIVPQRSHFKLSRLLRYMSDLHEGQHIHLVVEACRTLRPSAAAQQKANLQKALQGQERIYRYRWWRNATRAATNDTNDTVGHRKIQEVRARIIPMMSQVNFRHVDGCDMCMARLAKRVLATMP